MKRTPTPRTIQSGAKGTTGPAGQGNPWLKGALGEAANAAARTDTFLGARYRRLVKRRGHAKALLTRWWMTSRHRAERTRRHDTGPTPDDQIGELHPAMPDAASDHALREAEEHLSRHWNRLRSLYPRHPDDTPPH
ncbi:hypothetical protein ABZ612_30850 [Streptomyces avermitilis]|uniref:hypothetical protein n=1 Tax=Streptomyces avermitilis TaxID=33903 RepID=UPI0033E796E2